MVSLLRVRGKVALLLLAALTIQSGCENATLEMEGGCPHAFAPGYHTVPLRLQKNGWQNAYRYYVLHVPEAVGTPENANVSWPLLLLLPGQQGDPWVLMNHLGKTVDSPFILAILVGEDLHLNVDLDAKADPSRPDDVAYARRMVDDLQSKFCVDRRRIFCTGLSCGGRFCVKLASEMSDTIAAIGVYSGVRYPNPIKAPRPVPVIAFHGTSDSVDSYWGGGPEYWGPDSVPEAIGKWAKFNGCINTSKTAIGDGHATLESHTGCRGGADVELVSVEGALHPWPSKSPFYGHGIGHREVVSRTWRFLMDHPMPEAVNAPGVEVEAGSLMNLSQPEGVQQLLVVVGALLCAVPLLGMWLVATCRLTAHKHRNTFGPTRVDDTTASSSADDCELASGFASTLSAASLSERTLSRPN